MLNRVMTVLVLASIALTNGFAQSRPTLPLPSPAQLAWQESELVAVFHYDLHVFDGQKYVQARNRITPVPDYNIFNPAQLDTDQWIKAAKDMGAKIAILTATHETGFALYQSDVNPYCLKAVQWRDGEGDVVKDFVESCRKYDIQPGIYIGIRWNSFYGIHDFKVNGEGQFAQNRQAHYNKMCEGMVEELTSRYGDLAIIWFDGGAYGPAEGGPDVQGIVESNQPGAIFYHNHDRADIRWGGSESGTVPYPSWGTFPFKATRAGESARAIISANNFQLLKTGDPNGTYYMPAMSDAPLRGYNGRHEWFWEPGDEAHVYPLEKLMHMYENSVGHNSTLILGITPDDRGLVPEVDASRMKAFGEEVRRRYAEPIASLSGTGNKLGLKLKNQPTVHQVVVEEDIRFGERVREFVLEGKVNGKWTQLYKGSAIGHKHIAIFEGREVAEIRLVITHSIGEPKIRGFKVFG
ncbi:alpha-L-fucosidase [Echinicola sediminis]